MNCSFCGFEFDPDTPGACPACPLSANCGRVCCPRCGYEAARPSPWVERLRGWVLGATRSRRSVATDSALPLSDLPAGCRASVVRLAGDVEGRQSARLLAMGLLPGVDLQLLRRSPAFVFDIGFSRFAIDEPLARQVIVRAHPLEAP